ncbi:unnamed protein product [Dibothriocephalus latus]|uniref:Transcription and mRNA export factor ENY2 n=1 Tax=Dibothriocephalus latus TaxID=60516 RepID=A0A3P6QED7_DIBLA|nr:unnamed protein product [Dibothriocephalus latus]
MAEKHAEIRQKVNDLLISTGERERLRDMIEEQLKKSGWNDKVKMHCKEFIKSKGVDNVSVDDVVMGVSAAARSTVPKEVKTATLERLKQFMAKNNIEV